MNKISESDREKLIQDLQALYAQNLDFISTVENGTSRKQYKKEIMTDFKKLNEQLEDYIEDIKYGLEADKDLSDWCELLGDTLLDDDNFYNEEDGFSWH